MHQRRHRSKSLGNDHGQGTQNPHLEEQIAALQKANHELQKEIARYQETEEALHQAGRERERQIHTMAFQHTVSEERARRRLSLVLHDSICQSLGVAKLKLDTLKTSISPVGLKAPLDEVTQIIQTAISDIRVLIADLSPAVLHELGFEAGLDWLSEQFHKQTDIPCTFENDRFPKPLKEEVGILLFSSIRDLLMNVAKHAKAGSVKIRALRKHDKLYLVVEDDGVGFTPPKKGHLLEGNGGFGLFSIRERLMSIGGSMEIMSTKGKGTRITLVARLEPIEKT
jgi:signal transduction histidine kinase